MKYEYKLILELCKDNDGIEVNLSKDELKNLDWCEFLWQIVFNKVDCIIANKKINNLPIYKYNNTLKRYFWYKYPYIKAKNKIIYEKELPEVVNILNNVTLDYAFMKGVVSAISLYDNIGNRYFGDIDFLIKKSDLEKVKKAFKDAGYKVISSYDYDGEILGYATEEYIKKIEFYTDQTHIHTKIVKTPFLYDVSVDIHFGFGRPKREHVFDNEDLVGRILNRREKYSFGNSKFFGLSKEDFFLFSCLHLYKEEIEVYRLLFAPPQNVSKLMVLPVQRLTDIMSIS